MATQFEPNELIGLLFDAAMDESKWDRALARMCAMFDCVSGVVHIADMKRGHTTMVASWEVGSLMTREYESHYCKVDPWLAEGVKAIKNGMSGPFAASQHVSPAAFGESEFYNDFLRPNRHPAFYCLSGANLTGGGGR